jgi:hypothetical protein
MKNLFSIAIFSFLATVSLFGQKENRDLAAFSTLDVSGGISITLVKSDKPMAEITIISGELENLITQVSGNDLKIYFKKSTVTSWGSGEKAKIVLHYSTLNSIDASAGASVSAESQLKVANLKLEASSGASIALKTTTETVECQASSGARITLEGNAKSAKVGVSSGANINASLLQTGSVVAESSSGGSATVYPTVSLTAESSSGGSIKYKGDPKELNIEKDKFSGGDVSKI